MVIASDDPYRLSQKDEERLLALFDQIEQLRTALPDPDAPIIRRRDDNGKALPLTPSEQAIVDAEGKALEIVEGYFHQVLPGIMARLFGTKVMVRDQEATVRFTEILQNFFVKILEKRPDAFWRAKTAKRLRKWASVANANLIRDLLRREKRGNEILKEQFGPLLDELSRHFEKTSGLPIDARVLKQIERWYETGDKVRREWALVLRYRYLDGMKYPVIAGMLDLAESTIHQRRSDAIEWLREHLGEESEEDTATV